MEGHRRLMMPDLEKLPPFDIDAEEATIGSLLIDGQAIINVMFLNTTDFYDERNRYLYEAIKEVEKRHEGINQITIAQELDRQGRLEECGGAAYLSHLVSIVPTSMDLVHYANIVQRLSVARQMVEVGEAIERMGFKAPPDPGEALNKADELLLGIRRRTVGTPIISPEDRVLRLRDRYEQLYSQELGVAVKTGISSIDRLLGGGMFNSEMIVIAGRPGIGKTAFAQTIANNVGNTGRNVLFCSAEMSADSLSDRDIAGVLKVPLSQIRMGGYTDELFLKITGEGLDKLSNSSVYYYDDSPITTTKILNAGMEMKLRYGLSLIIIDYLGILGDEYGRTPYERVGYVSRKTKQLARILDVPTIALHQLSRGVEHREEKRPNLSDLRDAGNIEEDADVVAFIYRENYYDENTNDETTEFLLAKQRQGGNADHRMARLMFDKNSQCYRGVKEF